MKKGALIVLDGADGAGKATQTKLLMARLRKEGKPVKTLDFPQYTNNFFGGLIGECLAGEHGDFVNLDPYIASTLYAADRFESKKKIDKWLAQGYIVVLDRYVSANQIHQGGKITDARERKKFLGWLEKMEFGVYGLPKPNIIVYLDVPYEISKKLLVEKDAKAQKIYLRKGSKDQAEENESYLRKSRESAVKMVRQSNKWERVVCAQKGDLLTREIIHERIWDIVKKYA